MIDVVDSNALIVGIILMFLLQFVFDYNEGDVFGCVADIGWITGHTYTVYGPLCNGATSVLFESTPVYPDPGNCVQCSLLS